MTDLEKLDEHLKETLLHLVEMTEREIRSGDPTDDPNLIATTFKQIWDIRKSILAKIQSVEKATTFNCYR